MLKRLILERRMPKIKNSCHSRIDGVKFILYALLCLEVGVAPRFWHDSQLLAIRRKFWQLFVFLAGISQHKVDCKIMLTLVDKAPFFMETVGSADLNPKNESCLMFSIPIITRQRVERSQLGKDQFTVFWSKYN